MEAGAYPVRNPPKRGRRESGMFIPSRATSINRGSDHQGLLRGRQSLKCGYEPALQLGQSDC